jgi:ABC-type dipeptide/oligopeptide/nickel transport system permease component
VGVLPAVFPPEPCALAGLSLSLTLLARFWAGGVAAWVGGGLADADIDNVEFFLVAAPEPLVELMLAFFFAERVLVPPTGILAPEPRLRFLMTSVFRLSGLTTP